MTQNDFLKTLIKTGNTHQGRLEILLPDVEKMMPLTEDKIASLSTQDFNTLETFSARFAKLQDLIGAKIFPTVLKLAGFYEDADTVRDYLSKLERLHIIPNVQFWKDIRDLRNEFAHDYPDDLDVAAQKMNACFEKTQVLLAFWKSLKEYIHDHSML